MEYQQPSCICVNVITIEERKFWRWDRAGDIIWVFQLGTYKGFYLRQFLQSSCVSSYKGSNNTITLSYYLSIAVKCATQMEIDSA